MSVVSETQKIGMQIAQSIFGALALGLASTVVLAVIAFIVAGGEWTTNLIFGLSPAIFILAFGAMWYPYVRRRMR